MLGGLVVTNIGVLAVLLFGPNATRPQPTVAYGGVAIAVLGLVLLLRALIARRRTDADASRAKSS
jgi:hypothetical protein